MINQNWNRNQGGSSWGAQGSGVDRPMRIPNAASPNQNRAPIQSFAGPGGIQPRPPQTSQISQGPFNPYMSQQDYFKGIAPWGGNQSQLSMQNPMMSMGQQSGWGNQLQTQNPMMTMGMQGNQAIPSMQATSNPFMPSFQQIAPQQQPQNPYSPYRNDWGWAQQSPFAGLRYPAY